AGRLRAPPVCVCHEDRVGSPVSVLWVTPRPGTTHDDADDGVRRPRLHATAKGALMTHRMTDRTPPPDLAGEGPEGQHGAGPQDGAPGRAAFEDVFGPPRDHEPELVQLLTPEGERLTHPVFDIDFDAD